MRIIAGSAGRIPLHVPKAVARPSTDLTRQALFSLLGELVVDANVLDLFAGSGAIGLEALSRGATRATFVEQHRQAHESILKNAQKTKLSSQISLVKADVFSFLTTQAREKFSLIFADPPYAKFPGDPDFLAKLLASEHLPAHLAEDGWLIIEASSSQKNPLVPTPWTQIQCREYGGCALLFFQKSAV